MKELLTPKQVARAVGVSESSLKRWCDKGLLPTVRTAGGHRRIAVSGVLQFLRETGHELVEPQILGLPATSGQGERGLDRARKTLVDALTAGNEDLARRTAFDLYLAGHSLLNLCDRVIAPAFHEIGERWERRELEIYQERRAVQIALRILHEFRHGIPPTAPSAPMAVGATPCGDPYSLPTAMVELALRELGWNAVSLGSSLPLDTLKAALTATRPQLFWLSVTHLENPPAFLEGYTELYGLACDQQVPLVVGGQALTAPVRDQMSYTAFCDTLQHLHSLLATLSVQARVAESKGQWP